MKIQKLLRDLIRKVMLAVHSAETYERRAAWLQVLAALYAVERLYREESERRKRIPA